MKDGALLGHVDLLAAEHRLDPLGQPPVRGQPEEKPEGLIGNAMLGIVEVEARRFGRQALPPHAGEMINELTLSMVAGIGLRTLARMIHAYPTQAEAIKQAADAYTHTRLTPMIQTLRRRWVTR